MTVCSNQALPENVCYVLLLIASENNNCFYSFDYYILMDENKKFSKIFH